LDRDGQALDGVSPTQVSPKATGVAKMLAQAGEHMGMLNACAGAAESPRRLTSKDTQDLCRWHGEDGEGR